jgi:phenylalanine-4-hydroxylase
MNAPDLPPQTSADDPRCIPIKLAQPIPVGDDCEYPAYTHLDHDTWQKLYARQLKLLPGRGADEYLTGLALLGLDPERIPALGAVSRKLYSATGWKIARTPGLLDAHDFFTYLSNRIFPCTDYVRAPSELDYTPAPDCFHDIFGHTPMIVHPQFADFYQKIGQAALRCKDAALEEGLTRIYWFTVEFGLIKNPAGLRIYGNGIISSYGETLNALSSKVRVHPFLPGVVAQQPYDIWHYQDKLFVISSFEELESSFDAWCRRNGLA